ncbi:MAG: hypothetical protein M3N13_05835, partial [Candidatus Eremiobacteraeota bacterium]|nr:hypothetical protein [Candidatus Eremiobacteraeota bacterium]
MRAGVPAAAPRDPRSKSGISRAPGHRSRGSRSADVVAWLYFGHTGPSVEGAPGNPTYVDFQEGTTSAGPSYVLVQRAFERPFQWEDLIEWQDVVQRQSAVRNGRYAPVQR